MRRARISQMLGRTIVAVDLRPRRDPIDRKTLHDPVITLDDGTTLYLNAVEGSDVHGVEILVTRRADR